MIAPHSRYLKNAAFFIILATILIVNLLRFWNLENAPKGFYIDEITSAVNAHCMATDGTDYSGKKWPLFGFGFGSPKPPTQLYPLGFWVKIFGISIGSVRAFSAFAYTLGLIGLFLLARLMGGPTCAWATLLVSSISPWGWMLSRLAFESILGPLFLIWGVFCFLRNPRWGNMVLAGFFMACAMYSYPPTRLQAPLVILLLVGYQIKQKHVALKSLGIFFIVLAVCCVPLLRGTLQGPLLDRFNSISILSTTSSATDFLMTFTKNYFSHLSPQYLFLTGDNNYRHSTRHFGELSWLDMLGLGAGVWLFILLLKKKKRPSPLVIFLLMAAASGIVPAALTWESLPNALRSFGAQPFTELLLGYSLAQAIDRWPNILIVGSVTGAIFAASFLSVYFTTYPADSAEAFQSDLRLEAEHCKTDQDWVKFFLHYANDRIIFQYYLMRNYQKPYSTWFF